MKFNKLTNDSTFMQNVVKIYASGKYSIGNHTIALTRLINNEWETCTLEAIQICL